MKAPSVYRLEALQYHGNKWEHVKIGSGWYPARPLGYPSFRERLRITWLVFTGRADAVIWPGGQ